MDARAFGAQNPEGVDADSVIGQQQVSDAHDRDGLFARRVWSHRPSGVAGVARRFGPGLADVDGVFETQPLRPRGELHAAGFALSQNLWQVLQSERMAFPSTLLCWPSWQRKHPRK